LKIEGLDARSLGSDLPATLGGRRGVEMTAQDEPVARLSKNRLTVEHLKIACRHVHELTAAGVTENLAIRSLEIFSDFYAKFESGGSVTPHHVNQVACSQWSVAAKKLWRDNPNARPPLRVEHGTPRRAFARMVMKLFDCGDLTEQAMADLTKNNWKLAVITIDEDSRLNKFNRSKAHTSPDERWRSAGIIFDDSLGSDEQISN
jgi:hypothetical protein